MVPGLLGVFLIYTQNIGGLKRIKVCKRWIFLKTWNLKTVENDSSQFFELISETSHANKQNILLCSMPLRIASLSRA